MVENYRLQMENLIKDYRQTDVLFKGPYQRYDKEICWRGGHQPDDDSLLFQEPRPLFNTVLEEAMLSMMDHVKEISILKQPSRKIKSFLDLFVTETSNYPYLEILSFRK